MGMLPAFRIGKNRYPPPLFFARVNKTFRNKGFDDRGVSVF
jgi:hypothetical protein